MYYMNVLFWLHLRVAESPSPFVPQNIFHFLSCSDALSNDYSFKGTSSRRKHLKTQEGRGEKSGLDAITEELLFGVVKVHSLQQTCKCFRISQMLLQRTEGKRKLSFPKTTFLDEVWRTTPIYSLMKACPRKIKVEESKSLQKQRSKIETFQHHDTNTLSQLFNTG